MINYIERLCLGPSFFPRSECCTLNVISTGIEWWLARFKVTSSFNIRIWFHVMKEKTRKFPLSTIWFHCLKENEEISIVIKWGWEVFSSVVQIERKHILVIKTEISKKSFVSIILFLCFVNGTIWRDNIILCNTKTWIMGFSIYCEFMKGYFSF